MFPVFCVDEDFLGARASRPHNPRHSPAHFRHLDRSATAPGDRYFLMNIDAQVIKQVHAQQDERLLHQKPARAVIRCGLADAQDYKLAVS